MDLRLSIIIPIYNVESYIEKCLRSLEDQDISKESYEIICINDGSTDASEEVVEGLRKLFDNIILINQENQGVSLARNKGIEKARGKYLLFIDPDDYVDSKSLYRILKKADDNDAQVSFLGFTFLNENGTIRRQVFNETHISQIYLGIDSYFIARGDGRTDPDRIWGVLFDIEFLNSYNLRYLPDVPYLEDGELIARILCLAERCIFDGYSFYQRTTRLGSATNSMLFHSVKATNGFLQAANNLKSFQVAQKLNEKQIEFLNQPIVKFVVLVINSCFGRRRYSRVKDFKNKLEENGLYRCNLVGCSKIYKFYGGIYNYSPYLLAIILSIWQRVRRFFEKKFSIDRFSN